MGKLVVRVQEPVMDIIMNALAVGAGAIRCSGCKGAAVCNCPFCKRGPCPYCKGVGFRAPEPAIE